MRTNTLFLAPEIMNTFRISLLPESVYDVMKQTVKNVMADNPENRHGDYIDALLEMRKKGPWEGNDGEMIGKYFILYIILISLVAKPIRYNLHIAIACICMYILTYVVLILSILKYIN